MRNTYNKGRYKPEWHKHLRPFLKRVGNKKWRKDAAVEISQGIDDTSLAVRGISIGKKRPKPVKVKITLSNAGFVHSYYRKYESLEQAVQSIRRNSVARAFIFNRKTEIIKNRY